MISLEILKNCQKIKLLNPTEEQLIQAIKSSDFLEIDEDKKLFGRKIKYLPLLRERKFYVTLNR